MEYRPSTLLLIAPPVINKTPNIKTTSKGPWNSASIIVIKTAAAFCHARLADLHLPCR